MTEHKHKWNVNWMMVHPALDEKDKVTPVHCSAEHFLDGDNHDYCDIYMPWEEIVRRVNAFEEND